MVTSNSGVVLLRYFVAISESIMAGTDDMNLDFLENIQGFVTKKKTYLNFRCRNVHWKQDGHVVSHPL